MSRGNLKLVLFGIMLVVGLFGFAFAQQNPLDGELEQLEQELNDAGYSWLTDYNLSYPTIEVYRQNDSNLLATFDEISGEGLYKIFLTNLVGEQDVFDLRIIGGDVEFDWIVDPAGQTNNWNCAGT